MKKISFLVIFSAFVQCAHAASIPDTGAASHIGHSITLDCNAVSVYTSRAGNTFVNCGAAYPNQNASVVAFAGSTVGDLHQYEGKHLLVHGVVKIYKGKPEIVLVSASQIEGVR